MQAPIVFMFSGQGSQYYRMGIELYNTHSRFKYWMDYCDEIVRGDKDFSFLDILYDEHRSVSLPFDLLHLNSPALVSIEYSLACTVMEELDINPDYVLGYSLGEITAMAISGVLTIEEALRFTIDFADIVHACTKPAGTLAIIDTVDLMDRYPDIFQDIWLTGKNFRQNFVVSGLQEDISNLERKLYKENVIFQKLPINYGFHTPLMDPIEQKVKKGWGWQNFASPKVPMISALGIKAVEKIDAAHLWEIIRRPVLFEKTIRSMLMDGDYLFVDVGPSGTLSTAVKYILSPDSNSQYFEIMNQFGKNVDTYNQFKTRICS